MEVDLLLSGGTVISMNQGRSIIEDGAVAISGGRIVAIGKRAYVTRAHTAREVIDTTHHVVLPGLIDSHARAGHGLMERRQAGGGATGSAACRSVSGQAPTPAFWRADARLTALERMMVGVTTGVSLLGDSVMRADGPADGIAHADGAASIGIRDIMAIRPARSLHPAAGWIDTAAGGRTVPFEQQLETIQALIEVCHGKGHAQICLSLPVMKAVPDDSAGVKRVELQAQAIRDLQQRHRLLVHQNGHRSGSIAIANRVLGLIGPESVLSHCIDLTDDDIHSLERHNAAVVHHPSAPASGPGHCPVPDLLQRGVTVMLGSDSQAPDRSTDMFRHMFQCMRLHRCQGRAETLIPPGKALEMVTIDAARGLHMDRDIGSLEPGKKADIITIDLRSPHLAQSNMPVWRAVCLAGGADVGSVIVDGRVLMRGRVVTHVDIGQVRDDAQRETAMMLDRAGTRAAVVEPERLWGA